MGDIMCGRFIVSYSYEDLLKFISTTFDIFDLDPSIEVPRYNIAPQTRVLSVISDGEKYRAGNLLWGFQPTFKYEVKSKYKIINVRSEGIGKNGLFEASFLNKRCLILANGYYEWKNDHGKKVPYLIQPADKQMFFFAGIYNRNKDSNGNIIYTTAIITKEADISLREIHDRMPVILDEEHAKKWLDKSLHISEVVDIFSNTKEKFLALRVSGFVNNVKNDSLRCIEEFKENSLFDY